MTRARPRGILLASFLTTESEEKIAEEVQYIADNFELTNNYIFLLRDLNEPHKKVLTYNAVVERNKTLNQRLFTMRIHRKKATNTLYTINALNLAVAKDNNGETGRHLKLDWEKYSNSILLVVSRELKVHPVEVLKIFKIEEPPAGDAPDE
tara:strand:- start:879 stop:1331 length:453 start_codon:yes stop_codon:yes gene_type:complete